MTLRRLFPALCCSILLSAATARAGTLYGFSISGNFPNSSVDVVRIDPATGAFTTIVTPVTGSVAVGGPSAFDSANQHLFFYADSSGTGTQFRLYDVDLLNATFTSSSVVAQLVNSMQYDPVSGNLYGLTYNSSTTTEELVRVDPSTGGFTTVASPLSGAVFVNGTSAFDSAAGRYLYYASVDGTSTWQVYATSTITGFTTSSATVTQFAHGLVWDNLTGTLYANAYTGSFPSGSQQVGTIGLGTGAFTPVVTASTGSVVTPGIGALDPVGNRYFLYADPTGSGTNYQLYTTDLTGGGATGSSAGVRVPIAIYYAADSVPEPATWTLSALSLAIVTARIRRRK